MSKLIYKKMSEIMEEIGPVAKSSTNTSQGFKFRGIDQFVNSLHPALVKHGVFMTPECVSESHELKDVTRSNGKSGVDKHVSIMMKYHFYAEDGSSVTVGPIPAEGLDSGDKATNKALSASLKYALIQTFSIPTEDMAEGDLESPSISTTSNRSTIKTTTTATANTATVVTGQALANPSTSQASSGGDTSTASLSDAAESPRRRPSSFKVPKQVSTGVSTGGFE